MLEDEYGWEEVNFANAYRNWIERQMNGQGHRILFDYLYDTEFVWDKRIPMDENRAKDGVFLREEFSSEWGLEEPESARYWPCSFLEFLVALSRRIENQIMYDPESDTDASTWFWEMMGNSGLDRCNDDWMLSQDYMAHMMVSEMVNKVMYRRYSPTGEGGLFPLRDPEMDQRRIQIWDQMNEYFWENYVSGWE